MPLKYVDITDDQATLIQESEDHVVLRDPQGRNVACFKAHEAGDVEAIIRSKQVMDKNQPGIPSAQVQAFLRRLEEISQHERLDRAKVKELLRRARSGEEI